MACSLIAYSSCGTHSAHTNCRPMHLVARILHLRAIFGPSFIRQFPKKRSFSPHALKQIRYEADHL